MAVCENDLKPKIFLPMGMALYTIYIGGTAAPSQGPNFPIWKIFYIKNI